MAQAQHSTNVIQAPLGQASLGANRAAEEDFQMSTQWDYGGSQLAGTAIRRTFVAELGRAAGQMTFSAAFYIAGAFVKLRRRYQQAKAIRQLSEMSDHLLKDIGLSRADIRHAVRRPARGGNAEELGAGRRTGNQAET